MAQVCMDFQERGNVEPYARAQIQAMHDGVHLALHVPRQVRALGQALVQEAVGVLVGAALPRTVRIDNEDLDRKPLGQLFVLGHLFPPTHRPRFCAAERVHAGVSS